MAVNAASCTYQTLSLHYCMHVCSQRYGRWPPRFPQCVAPLTYLLLVPSHLSGSREAGGSGPANWRRRRRCQLGRGPCRRYPGPLPCPVAPGTGLRTTSSRQRCCWGGLAAASRASRLAHSVSVSGCCWRPYSAAADRVKMMAGTSKWHFPPICGSYILVPAPPLGLGRKKKKREEEIETSRHIFRPPCLSTTLILTSPTPALP